MKHVLPFLLSLFLIFSLSSCGISQEKYDELLNENNTLKSELESLSSEKESLSFEIETLLDEKTNQLLDVMDDNYAKAWATAAFGDNSLCFTDDNRLYLQCISGKTYSISNEGISELWHDMLESTKTLTYMQLTYPDNFIYETISVKFYDSSNVYIVEINLKQNGESYLLDSIACNSSYANTIIPAFTALH